MLPHQQLSETPDGQDTKLPTPRGLHKAMDHRIGWIDSAVMAIHMLMEVEKMLLWPPPMLLRDQDEDNNPPPKTFFPIDLVGAVAIPELLPSPRLLPELLQRVPGHRIHFPERIVRF